MSWESDCELLNDNDWIIECESPFEIRKQKTGDFASGEAAYIVLAVLKEEAREEQEETDRNFVTRETIEDSLVYHKDKLQLYSDSPESSIYKCIQSRIHLLEQQLNTLK